MLKTTLKFPLGHIARSCSPCRVVLRHEIRRQQSTHAGQSRGGGKILFALGTITVATAGAAVYAKYDPSFRKLLQDNIPYVDEVLNKSSELVDMATNLVGLGSNDTSSSSKLEQKPVIKPEAIKPSPVVKPPPMQAKPAEEAKPVEKIVKTPEKVTKTVKAPIEKVAKLDTEVAKRISSLQASIQSAGDLAVEQYTEALQKLKVLEQELSSYSNAGVQFIKLSTLIKAQQNADAATDIAKQTTALARKELLQLQKELESSGLPDSVDEIHKAKLTYAAVDAKLTEHEQNFHYAHSNLKPSKELEEQFQLAKEALKEEFGSTFSAHSSKEDDLLMLEIALRINQYRKQNPTSEQPSKDMQEVWDELTKNHEFAMKQLKIQEEKRLERSLEQQALLLNEDKENALLAQRDTYANMLTERLDKQLRMYANNIGIVTRAVEKTHKILSEKQNDIYHGARLLAMSRNCDILLQSLYTNPFPALDWTHQRRVIDGHVRDVKQAFSGHYEDEFVNTTLSMLPSTALSRGVFTEPALRARFTGVESVARRVAMITKQENVPLSAFILSYLRSMMILLPVSPIQDQEIADAATDVSQLNNDGVLDRARYFIDQGDLKQAVRYMNLLQGPSRFVASGWLEEARLLLEVQNMALTLSTYASMLVHKKIGFRELPKKQDAQ